MASIRPVLLVGTGDFSWLVAALRRHGLGLLVAANTDVALRLLRHFQVDVILTTLTTADDLAMLAKHSRTPVVSMGADYEVARNSGCVTFIATSSDSSALAEFLHLVTSGRQPFEQTKDVA